MDRSSFLWLFFFWKKVSQTNARTALFCFGILLFPPQSACAIRAGSPTLVWILVSRLTLHVWVLLDKNVSILWRLNLVLHSIGIKTAWLVNVMKFMSLYFASQLNISQSQCSIMNIQRYCFSFQPMSRLSDFSTILELLLFGIVSGTWINQLYADFKTHRDNGIYQIITLTTRLVTRSPDKDAALRCSPADCRSSEHSGGEFEKRVFSWCSLQVMVSTARIATNWARYLV